MKNLMGIGASPGYVMGRARRLKAVKNVSLSADPITDVENEINLLRSALASARDEIEKERDKMSQKLSKSELEIFEAHVSILDDPELFDQTVEEVKESKINSAYVFDKVARNFQEQLLALNDDYLSARANDIREVADRVLQFLSKDEVEKINLDRECILVCELLSTHQLANLDTSKVKAILSSEGGLTDHVAIICKALGMPLVVGLKDLINQIDENSLLIVDSSEGRIICEPTDLEIEEFKKKAGVLHELEEDAFRKRHEKAVSQAGKSIKVFANVASLEDVEQAIHNGAEGIGLLRTELSFLQRGSPPSENDHQEFYERILLQMGDKETVIRLMDFGTDKPIPYLKLEGEENPALGVRALRLGFKYYKTLLGPQIRALLKLSSSRKIQVLCPMIASIQDLDQIISAFKDEEIAIRQDVDGFQSNIELGIMVEVPFVAFFPHLFVDKVDFFSFGTNDLAQFMMAADRSNSEVSNYLEDAESGILELVRRTVDVAHEKGKWVGICGEMASDHKLLSEYIKIGVDEISMPSNLIPAVKEYIRLLP